VSLGRCLPLTMSQGQSGNAGHGLVWHCPALFLVPDPDWGIKPTLASGCRAGPPAYVAWRVGTKPYAKVDFIRPSQGL